MSTSNNQSSNVMKITHKLKVDQQFTVDDLEQGEVFTVGAHCTYIKGEWMTDKACKIWNIDQAESGTMLLNQQITKVTAELILS